MQASTSLVLEVPLPVTVLPTWSSRGWSLGCPSPGPRGLPLRLTSSISASRRWR
uniref:Sut2 n=1 Tax=Arundo donax TaxID=35708 RepID=A0A0A9FNT8_ARUDO